MLSTSFTLIALQFCLLFCASFSTLLITRSGNFHVRTASVFLWGSFLLSLYAVVASWGDIETVKWTMVHFYSIPLVLVFELNALTSVMLPFVLFIAVIIYHYAQRYLLSDVTRSRFLSQLLLVVVSVVCFLLSGNLLTAFIGWMLIGLSLYVLLNHYHFDLQANRSAKKKFVLTRIGDLCFLVAVILSLQGGESQNFISLSHLPNIEYILALVLVAVFTKAAQFPFHIWLPDTMETPTPVSALMHAGVINAGGILLAKLAPIIVVHPQLLYGVLIIGLLTAIFGSFVMRHRPDTKKRLAYSTMGQMGYMVMQCGLGAFAAAVFHLIAHGFYKATLFLNAGNTLPYYQPVKNKRSRIGQLLGLTLGIMLVLVAYQAAVQFHLTLPILIWTFMAITLCQVSLAQCEHGVSVKSLLVIISYGLGVLTYVYLLSVFTRYVNLPEVALLSDQTQYWLSALIILTALSTHTIVKAAVIKRLLYCNNIETFYRQYLLLPYRTLGDWLNHGLDRLRLQWVAPIIVIALLSCLFILSITRSTELFPLSETFQWLLVITIIVAALISNRASRLRLVLIWLVVLEAAIACIGMMEFDPEQKALAYYHCVNISLTFFMLMIVLFPSQDSVAVKTRQALQLNRLPYCVFYISVALLLLIGIPGTSSFISEFYFLAALYQKALWLCVSFCLGMLLLTISLLHALQDYVFDGAALSKRFLDLTPTKHFICWSVIVFNVWNGIHPSWLLQKIQFLLG